MKSVPFHFFLKLFISLGIAFGGHLLILKWLQQPLFNHLIIPAYLINFLLAYIIFIILFSLRKKLASSLGFLFMGGSLIKFIVFFIVFNPVYKADAVIEKTELTAFFIPYAVSLFIEVLSFTKLLKED